MGNQHCMYKLHGKFNYLLFYLLLNCKSARSMVFSQKVVTSMVISANIGHEEGGRFLESRPDLIVPWGLPQEGGSLCP